ncbi:MAG TPA: glycoside hydrolase family 97 protein [Steroidobacteraceae bacterium]|jgi:alpha-glucosidase|nr:glycoside hydrolase family 97 protein [Steroidobacteraceae bacterium]
MIRALSSLLIAMLALPATAETFRLHAPAEALEAVIRADDTLTLEVRYRGKSVARTPAVGLDVDGHLRANALPRLSGSARRSVNETIRPVVPEKRAVIPDRYNELRLSFGPKLAATFRVYDDGVAYRFETAIDGEVIVRNESAGLRLAKDDAIWIALVNCRTEPGVDCFQSSYEENYQQLAADAVPDARLAYLPITVQTASGYLGFTESDLRDYPGLWLRHVPGEPALAGDFARYPLEEQVFGGEFRQSLVTRRADYLARTPGTRTFPWRVLMVSADAAGLLGNDLVYRLASPLELQDVAWIRPGQSTEEWITGRLLYGVDFTSGLNTATYRHYIDFAAEYGVEYMMFDAGWSDADDTTKLNPNIDVPDLIAYANGKGVGVLLWNEARALAGNLEQALDRYAAWGARGIMVDFMDRDDQPMLRFQERLARAAAQRHLVVNLHGVAKPTGLQRAYPNLLTREAVLGHEYNMWSERVTPDHALTVPFVRMLAGPMDWEGGAMLNGTAKTFRVVGEQPMSQGTRTQQLAQYVIYDSPLQYLAGTPSAYRAEPEFTRFLGGIPTAWDETRPLQGAIGDYVVVARRAGDTWYVAAMTDWTARKIELSLSFLPPGEYSATIVADGRNADRYAADYQIESRAVGPRSSLPIELAPGGGYVVRLTR